MFDSLSEPCFPCEQQLYPCTNVGRRCLVKTYFLSAVCIADLAHLMNKLLIRSFSGFLISKNIDFIDIIASSIISSEQNLCAFADSFG